MQKVRQLVDILNIQYKLVLDSTTENQFYQNVHSYIDVIMKTPELKSIIEAAEQDYYNKHTQIWSEYHNDDFKIDDQDLRTYKMERFNLYSRNFVGIHVRIYLPIEDYKNSDDPIDEQDPVAMIALHGLKSRYIKQWTHGKKRSMEPKDAYKRLKIYSRWFDGKRSEYEESLKMFHADFVTAVLTEGNNTEKFKPIHQKIPLALDLRTGDFKFYKISNSFNPKSQEFKVLSKLYTSENHYAEYPDLIAAYRPYNKDSAKTIKPELSQIIKSIKIKLGILQSEDKNPDIFENITNVGYRLINPDIDSIPE